MIVIKNIDLKLCSFNVLKSPLKIILDILIKFTSQTAETSRSVSLCGGQNATSQNVLDPGLTTPDEGSTVIIGGTFPNLGGMLSFQS